MARLILLGGLLAAVVGLPSAWILERMDLPHAWSATIATAAISGMLWAMAVDRSGQRISMGVASGMALTSCVVGTVVLSGAMVMTSSGTDWSTLPGLVLFGLLILGIGMFPIAFVSSLVWQRLMAAVRGSRL